MGKKLRLKNLSLRKHRDCHPLEEGDPGMTELNSLTVLTVFDE